MEQRFVGGGRGTILDDISSMPQSIVAGFFPIIHWMRVSRIDLREWMALILEMKQSKRAGKRQKSCSGGSNSLPAACPCRFGMGDDWWLSMEWRIEAASNKKWQQFEKWRRKGGSALRQKAAERKTGRGEECWCKGDYNHQRIHKKQICQKGKKERER